MPFINVSHVSGSAPYPDAARLVIVSTLVVVQVVLFSYLMSVNLSTALLLAGMCSLLILLIGYLLFNAQGGMRYGKMAAVMFAGGGVGMLLGCTADLGQLGLYGLLSLCQAKPVSLSLPGLEMYWQKMQLTPWTYIGMFLGGNLGMFLLEDRRGPAPRSRRMLTVNYLICNLGMLLGMLLAEVLNTEVVALSNQLLAAGLMFLLMLMGMVLGMLALLLLTTRLGLVKLALRY